MKRRGVLLGAIALAVVSGCGTVPPPSASPGLTSLPSEAASPRAATPKPAITPDAWAPLFRPLELPSIEPGEACPATGSSATLDNIGPVLGDGPIYPAFLGLDGVFTLGIDMSGNEPVRIDERDWWGKKTLWLSDDSYAREALVRGGSVDQKGEMIFWTVGGGYDSALRLTVEPWVSGGSPSGWREWNGGAFFTEPGCYAYQIDGEGFTDVVVVEATR